MKTVTHHEPVFPSSNTFSIDESKLCFNKTHFNREDFNVERFMNLARQKADLKTIQQDLQLYLKSVQNSMIEMINDDYADFVHLSSNLVSLQDNLSKISHDVDRNWLEFEDSTKESVGMAERIEKKCNELRSNREKQTELRDRISYLCAIEKLSAMLSQPPKRCSVLWLQKAATFVMELKSTPTSRHHSEEEKNAETKIMSRLESVLCLEGVQSASSDCESLPLVLSILTLSGGLHSFTACLVSDLLYPKFVDEVENNKEEIDHSLRLQQVYENVKQMRQTWADILREDRFYGHVRSFLDETLLTFVLTFLDKCMGTIVVPSDTRLFHKCFLLTQNFIDTWPSASFNRDLLKSIRDKFNLLVYLKLETHRFSQKIDQLLIPENYKISSEFTNNDGDLHFETSRAIFSAIEHMWSDDVYLPPIIDKLWDFTLRMLMKHLGWCQTMESYLIDEKCDWSLMLFLRKDAEQFHEDVFNFALESIWGKFDDMSVDKTPFGQCLTKQGLSVKNLCEKIDHDIVNLFSNVVHRELSQVSDVPKQYRWTKKSPPTTYSKYVEDSIEMMKNFRIKIEQQEHPDVTKLVELISKSAFSYFVEKAKEVQDGVEATGSSLSRFKRKTALDSASVVTDDDKIKRQIYHDGLHLLEYAQSLDVLPEDLLGLQGIVNRFDVQKELSKTQENSEGAEENS